MPIAVDRFLRPSKDVLVQQVGEESVLLNLATERYHGFDAVGTRMWLVLTSADSIEQARERLFTEYDVSKAQLDRDIEEFVAQVVDLGLAELRER